MPYIAIQAYPKDEATKQKVVERINQVFLEEWGCAPEAISISIEEVPPADWEETVMKAQVMKKTESMMILSGEKRFQPAVGQGKESERS